MRIRAEHIEWMENLPADIGIQQAIRQFKAEFGFSPPEPALRRHARQVLKVWRDRPERRRAN